MSAHTPGPWYVAPGNFIVADLLVPGDVTTGRIVAEVPCQGANMADLPLIAAAPRMLEVLTRLIAWTPPTPPDYAIRGAAAFTPEASYLIDAQNTARAILRDVEGTTP